MSPASQPAIPPLNGELAPGDILGRYELLLPIASGGMAAVWAARMKGTRGFQKIVAVKTMLPKLTEDAQFEQMFLDEASLASQVRHPHVVEILDLGERRGVLYLVMEWIDGVPLHELMKAAKPRGGLPLPVAVRIATQAASGLHAAHELRNARSELVGLVHRDVSPQNVLVTYTGVTKVVDFGVAKATALNDGATGHGQLKGKVSYMAPEQVLGEAMDRRADIFAMGIVLYALTTGKHPFRGESEAATLFNISSSKPAMGPRRVIPGYPEALERVVMQALHKDPAKRFATANDLARALDQAVPAEMRASTDEDVAAFVRSTVGEQREQTQRALTQALKRLDEGPSLVNNSNPEASHTPVSVVTDGSAGSLSGAMPVHLDDSGLDASDLSLFIASRRRRRLWYGAAVLGVLGLAGAATVWTVHEGDDTGGTAKVTEPNSPQPEKERATEQENDARDVVAVDPESLPTLPVTEPSVEPLPVDPAPVYRAPPRSKKPDQSWKQDPGF